MPVLLSAAFALLLAGSASASAASIESAFRELTPFLYKQRHPLRRAALNVEPPFDWSGLGPYFEARAAPLDFKALVSVPEPVVYFGEDHSSLATRALMGQSMKDLAAGGITHLGMEMVDDVAQPLLDDFQAGRKTRADLLRYLQKHEFSSQWHEESYVQVMEAAHRAGLKIVGLNMLYDGRPEIDENVMYNCRDKAKTPTPCDLIQSLCVHWDCWMASTLHHLLKREPKARVAVLIGYAHVHARAQPRYLWEERRIASRSYRFAMNKALTDPNMSRLNAELERQGLGGRRTFLPVARDKTAYDGFILTPELLNEKLFSKPGR